MDTKRMAKNGRIGMVWMALLLAAFVGGNAAAAEDKYPSKPIQMIVPTGSGTATDLVARVFAQKLGAQLGQAVVVLNRQGAGGTIATQMMLQAPADGYTLMMTNGAHAINPWVYRTLPFDTVKDLRGIAMVGDAPMALVVPKALGVNSVKEFIAYAKQHPGQLNYGSAGTGSATHLAGASFASAAGIKLVHIPYKGASEVLADVMTNRIQAVFAPIAFTLPAVRSGRAIVLAVCAPHAVQMPLAAPAVGAEGLPGFEAGQWFGIVAAAGVPDRVVDELARAVRAVESDKVIVKTMTEQGILARHVFQNDFDVYIKSDIKKYGAIVQAAGIQPN